MTPSLPNAASVAILRGGEVLLICRAFEPFIDCWTLPGGRLEPGETALDAAIREIGEELGLTVTGLSPVTELSIGHGFRLAVFRTTQFSGDIAPSPEIRDWRWARPDQIGGLLTTPELADVLRLAFAGADN